ncbi:MAG TPA: Rnf-Nqr domain containing protein [Candidatus Eisenbacteria bacterium]|nr:Rnf-Nqr domain containing protein [Candidatus Eisenbacteria bacterium]
MAMRDRSVPRRAAWLRLLVLAGLVLLFMTLAGSLAAAAAAEPNAAPTPGGGFIRGARILAPDHLRLRLAGPPGSLDPSNFRVTDARAPDVPIEVRDVVLEKDDKVLLTVGDRLDPAAAYRVTMREPAASRDVRPAPWALLLTIVLSSALINNFVFTRYLGLCIFFGVSKKRDTAVGMGLVFSLVMILSAMLSWALYSLVMAPLQLKFLQVIVFIGVVAFLVQALDTILKKTHRSLHQKWGVYLMLITTNCIILAVPLLNAAADSGPADSFALALGSGIGFAIALFLMSCAREKLELARVPAVFQGLPIAFTLAGLFALAFMGFSGLTFLR